MLICFLDLCFSAFLVSALRMTDYLIYYYFPAFLLVRKFFLMYLRSSKNVLLEFQIVLIELGIGSNFKININVGICLNIIQFIL